MSFTNVAAAYDTVSCAAPVSLSVCVLPPRAPPTPLTATPLSLSVLVGGVGFVTWAPLLTTDSTAPLSLSILMGGGGVLIPGPPRAPPIFLSISVLVGIVSRW